MGLAMFNNESEDKLISPIPRYLNVFALKGK